ncbi:hypothetical protein Tco_0097473 [Tanacetum coccineum]
MIRHDLAVQTGRFEFNIFDVSEFDNFERNVMNALRRELSEGLFPLPEIFTALVHLFGSKGYANRGLEILAAMDKLNYDIRHVWLVLIGVESRLRATDEIYDLLIEEDCKAADHSNASRDLKQVQSVNSTALPSTPEMPDYEGTATTPDNEPEKLQVLVIESQWTKPFKW